MGVIDIFKKKKSFEELEEENEYLDQTITNKQKRLEIKRLNEQLKPHGLNMKDFLGNIGRAKDWLANH
jgi:FtsZ-binding cell division protein ZapB